MRLTIKQIELLTVIARGNGENDPLDLDQILDNLAYETTKQSLQFSIRALMVHKLIIRGEMQQRARPGRESQEEPEEDGQESLKSRSENGRLRH